MAARRWRDRLATVRVRLTVLAVLVVGMGLIAGAIAVLVLVRHGLTVNAQNEAQQRARDTVTLLAGEEPPAVLPAFVQIIDRDGRAVAAGTELRGGQRLLPRWPEQGRVTGTVSYPPNGDGADYAVVGLPTTLAGRPVAVYAAVSLDHVEEGVEATASALAVAVPLLLVIIAGTSWLLVGRALRSVESIRSQVAEITASELDRRVPEPAVQDELGRLACTMNAMLARLQNASDRQRQFVGDAAHELRSPLASIQARLEVGLAHADDTDWVALAREVHREGSRLNHLADELLVLSRTDGTGNGMRDGVVRVDLDEVVLLEIDAVRARGKVSVDLAPFSAARLRGRPEDLCRVVRNLLDNAERHAASALTVGLATDGPVAHLVVADDGDGISPTDRERVFDRFFRLQPARDRDSGGAGLGLAIVRDVVAAHGGRVWLADSPIGAEFHVQLPLAPPDHLE
jgi:signal transduction histidine kinase